MGCGTSSVHPEILEASQRNGTNLRLPNKKEAKYARSMPDENHMEGGATSTKKKRHTLTGIKDLTRAYIPVEDGLAPRVTAQLQHVSFESDNTTPMALTPQHAARNAGQTAALKASSRAPMFSFSSEEEHLVAALFGRAETERKTTCAQALRRVFASVGVQAGNSTQGPSVATVRAIERLCGSRNLYLQRLFVVTNVPYSEAADATVSFVEFLKLLQLAVYNQAELLALAFQTFDANGDGVIDDTEFSTLVRSVVAMHFVRESPLTGNGSGASLQIGGESAEGAKKRRDDMNNNPNGPDSGGRTETKTSKATPTQSADLDDESNMGSPHRVSVITPEVELLTKQLHDVAQRLVPSIPGTPWGLSRETFATLVGRVPAVLSPLTKLQTGLRASTLTETIWVDYTRARVQGGA